VTEPDAAQWSARRITYFAILTTAAIIISAVESMIPIPAPAPGVKLGLANIVTLILIIDERNPYYALVVTAARCFLTALIFGTFSSIIFSLSGGIISCLIMWCLLHYNFPFSIVGASVAGAIAHNIAQLAAASFIARSASVFSYLPILLITGAAAGCATGFTAVRIRTILKKIRK
jgi:heptaprenyl diphosphate synthase